MSEWIDANEELPPDSLTVIARFEGITNPVMAIYHYDEGRWHIYLSDVRRWNTDGDWAATSWKHMLPDFEEAC